MPPKHYQNQALPAKAHFIMLFLAFLLLATTASASTPPGTHEPHANNNNNNNNNNTTALASRQQEISVGSSCTASEGLWNCMTTDFQRCASGRWSPVQQCALGTKCWPAGLTYQFYVDYADGYLGAAPQPSSQQSPPTSGEGGRGVVGWWLVGLVGGAVVVMGLGLV